MVSTRKKPRPSKQKRLAGEPASSTQAITAGAAGTGETRSFSLPLVGSRFFDRFSRREAPALLALTLLVGICYLPAMLRGGLIWDDFIWSQSPAVLEWSGLGAIWSWPPQIEGEKHYWPLTYTTFWLEHKIWGLEPAGYHVVNVLLHLLNSLLLWQVLLRLAVPGAWAVAAVFAVHPLHVESVAWIIERKDVLSGLFYLTAVLVWLRFLEQPRPWRYGLALLLFAAGLLSKSIVVTLPAALLIVQWWKAGRIGGRDLQRLAPFFLVALLITAADLYSYDLGRTNLDYSLPERVLIASRALWFYAGKLAWPTDLAIIYPLWHISLRDPWAWLYLAGAAALAATLWFTRHRIGRGPLAGALFFVVTLSPVLGFVNYGYMGYSLVADRFQYLACIGVMAVLIGAAVQGAGRLSGGLKMGATGLLLALLALLGTTTWRQAEIYRDDLTFFSHIISLNPEARNAHRLLSRELTKSGRLEESLAAARIAAEQQPDKAISYSMIGELLANLKRLDEAEENFRRAVEINPSREHELRILSVLGRTSWEQGRLQAAEKHFRRVLDLDPRNREALKHLAGSYFKQKRWQEALDLYRTLLEVDPEDANTHFNIGASLYYLGQPEAALQNFKRALSLDPTLEQARTGFEELQKTLRPSGKEQLSPEKE
ncbi:MAG: tetratricopeptide repeat protein [Acidobacteria bacterium]|nr:tetratricopeptide repeat protein [Acidobacteriota bacterium]